MDYFRVKNWGEFQHYKQRNPPWIKFYTSLLDKYEFTSLPDNVKWQWAGILLLAAKTGNKLPVDPEWLRGKLGCHGGVDLQPFVALDYIEPWDASKTLATDACTSREEERDRKKEGPKGLSPRAEEARQRFLRA